MDKEKKIQEIEQSIREEAERDFEGNDDDSLSETVANLTSEIVYRLILDLISPFPL